MKANAVALIALFEKKMRLEVPLFQRAYVWNQNEQWAPLWEDIERKFVEYLEAKEDISVHFLGALVLDQKQTPATHVERRLVIDGQQRLTTLQIFLNAFRDFCRAQGAQALADECANYTLNKGMMPDPAVDKFKVWPTQLDRPAFMAVVEGQSPEALKKQFPLIRPKYARKPDPRPLLVECYLYYYEKLNEFFTGSEKDPPLSSEYPVEQRLEQCFQALRNALMVVAIDLEHGDDAQVIFETLNARGQALLPADLLRNYIFLRASRRNESAEALYQKHWSEFDSDYWRKVVSQGRLSRPRSDLFMQHFLASQQATEIPIGHLYTEYRNWIEKKNPYSSVEAELQALEVNREHFQDLLDATAETPFFSLANFLKIFDISTVYPFMLVLLEKNFQFDEVESVCDVIESYLLRRAVCGLTTKNYNRIFIQLAKSLRGDTTTIAQSVASYLRGLRGESVEWPSDEEFGIAWETKELYNLLSSSRIAYILSRLNESFLNNKTKTLNIESRLSVEHVMPQGWRTNWRLADGTEGIDEFDFLSDFDENDPRGIATRERDRLIHTIGNLTLLRQELNSSLSNAPWSEKKKLLMDFSLLPINLALQNVSDWNEDIIINRGRDLFTRAIKIWPR